MRPIAFYLPQFHQTPENDAWWGKGFTEWTNVRAAKPLFEGHYQPRIPLGNNYYDLTNHDVLQWQANLAKSHGLYGWCIYHYWFDGHLLLHKPVELLRDSKSVDINYCLCWANEDWTNAWVSSNSKTLISQTYGDRGQWIEHFQYLQPFFQDDRYIKVDGRPLFVIYRPELIPHLNEMLDCWSDLAVKDGFKGMCYAYQHINWLRDTNRDESRFDYAIEYQPTYGRADLSGGKESAIHVAKRHVDLAMQKHLHKQLDLSFLRRGSGPDCFSYDDVWEAIIRRKPTTSKAIAGAFVDWDNTPRRHQTGSVALGATPEKFYSYMKRQIEHVRSDYSSDFIFIFAWNEWAEGGYMEPDERFKTGYLDALRRALEETDEFPSLREG